MNWGEIISLKAWIRAAPSLFEAGLLPFGMGQSHIEVLSLDPGYLSLCTHSAGWVYVSTCYPGASAYPIFLPELSPSSMH